MIGMFLAAALSTGTNAIGIDAKTLAFSSANGRVVVIGLGVRAAADRAELTDDGTTLELEGCEDAPASISQFNPLTGKCNEIFRAQRIHFIFRTSSVKPN